MLLTFQKCLLMDHLFNVYSWLAFVVKWKQKVVAQSTASIASCSVQRIYFHVRSWMLHLIRGDWNEEKMWNWDHDRSCEKFSQKFRWLQLSTEGTKILISLYMAFVKKRMFPSCSMFHYFLAAGILLYVFFVCEQPFLIN